MSGGGSVLGVYSGVLAGFQVEDACLDPFLLADTCLALPVEVPDRLRKRPGNVGTLLLECVPDVMRGNKVRLASLKSTGNAQQADNVRVVGVEELADVSSASFNAASK